MDGSYLGGSVILRIAAPLGLLALWPTPLSVVLAVAIFVIQPRLLRLLESESARERRLGVDREIALVAELLSAHLSAGAGLLDAVESTAYSLRSQLHSLTIEVAQRLRAGDPDPFRPWRDIPGLIPLAESAATALRTGASLSAAAHRVATRTRRRQFHVRQAALERAIIRMTLPLGICLLPAFVLTVVFPMGYVLFSKIDF